MANAIIDRVLIGDYDTYHEAMDDMNAQGVVHLGWLNGGVKIPEHCTFQRVYKNSSGSSCLFCDPVYRVSYSVDMGD